MHNVHLPTQYRTGLEIKGAEGTGNCTGAGNGSYGREEM